MSLQLVTAPAVEPVTLEEVKAHLRVDHDDDDLLIADLIRTARSAIDGPNGALQRALVAQTWDLYLDRFPCNEIRLPLSPLQSVVHIRYDDALGDEQTLADTNYTVDATNEPGWVLLATNTSWPATFYGINAVRIRFIAGYPEDGGDSPPDLAGNIPPGIKHAIKMLISHWYANRESVLVGSNAVEIPQSVEWLLNPYKVYI